MRYSKTTGWFYDSDYPQDKIPPDAVEVNEADRILVMEEHAKGKVIQGDANGYPVAVAVILTLDETKSAKLAELSAACAAQIYAGFTSSALGAPYSYPAKDKDQANLIASVTASLVPNLPAGWTTNFWCMDSSGAWALRPHTVAQIQQAGLDGKAAIEAAIQKNADLAAQVANATTKTAVGKIVW